jgi:uncharacterized MAPEG superfamily protein
MITWSEPSHIIALIFMFNWIALSLKLSLTGLLTGVFRGVEKIPKTQEDAKLAKVDLVTEESTKFNDSKVKRMGLIHGNELENLLPALFVSMAFIAATTLVPRYSVAAGWTHCAGGSILLTLFTIIRYAYAPIYFFGLQPWRSIAFVAGNVTLGMLAVWAIVAIFV